MILTNSANCVVAAANSDPAIRSAFWALISALFEHCSELQAERGLTWPARTACFRSQLDVLTNCLLAIAVLLTSHVAGARCFWSLAKES